jgi:dihydrofolate reductase
MRQLILKMSITLDGFVGSLDGDLKWIFKTGSDDAKAWTVDKVWQAGAHLMGRKTFNDMAAYWPNSTEVFAPPMNEIPKIVFSNSAFYPSRTAESAAARSWATPTVISGGLAAGISELKKQTGKELVAHGGASFARSLVQTGLIDEFWLLTHPVAIGQGLSLFTGLKSPLYLQLIDVIRFDSGAAAHVYRPKD